MKIGIFGGTFDPPHNGHINLALKIIENKMTDRIIFIPAASPPHKPGRPVSPFEHRLNMLELATNEVKAFSVSDIEYKRLPAPSYTYETMLELKSVYFKDNLVLIIGGDSLAQLHLWHKGRDIVNNWKIITYPRRNKNITLESLSKNWPLETAKKLLKTILPFSVLPVSSTYIRKKIIHKEKVRTLVKPEVLDYIAKNNLYRSNKV